MWRVGSPSSSSSSSSPLPSVSSAAAAAVAAGSAPACLLASPAAVPSVCAAGVVYTRGVAALHGARGCLAHTAHAGTTHVTVHALATAVDCMAALCCPPVGRRCRAPASRHGERTVRIVRVTTAHRADRRCAVALRLSHLLRLHLLRGRPRASQFLGRGVFWPRRRRRFHAALALLPATAVIVVAVGAAGAAFAAAAAQFNIFGLGAVLPTWFEVSVLYVVAARRDFVCRASPAPGRRCADQHRRPASPGPRHLRRPMLPRRRPEPLRQPPPSTTTDFTAKARCGASRSPNRPSTISVLHLAPQTARSGSISADASAQQIGYDTSRRTRLPPRPRQHSDQKPAGDEHRKVLTLHACLRTLSTPTPALDKTKPKQLCGAVPGRGRGWTGCRPPRARCGYHARLGGQLQRTPSRRTAIRKRLALSNERQLAGSVEMRQYNTVSKGSLSDQIESCTRQL
eukprot:366213-Chlamydomonas_euryale.AAC.6